MTGDVARPDWYSIPADYFHEPSGALGVLETGKHVPFVVRRVFWLFGVPDERITRGEHAHGELQQVVFCARGSCRIRLEARDGRTAEFTLAAGGEALYLNGPVWRVMDRFSPDAAFVALCDREYAYDHVVRSRAEFLGQ